VTAPAFHEPTLRRLHEELGAEGDVTLDIVQTFLRSADDLVREAREAIAKGDAQVVQRVAHTLKSSAGIVGAQRLSELAREMETALATGARPSAAGVEALAEALTLARGALEAWRP
jgi:two-component system sensor histidine kinase/response regulator